MAVVSLDKKVEKFYDEGYMSKLFPRVWIGWRVYGRAEVFRAFKYVLGEQLGLSNIDKESHNGIVKEMNGLASELAWKLHWRNRLNERWDLVSFYRKKVEENPTIEVYVRCAQSEQYLKIANSKPSHTIAAARGL